MEPLSSLKSSSSIWRLVLMSVVVLGVFFRLAHIEGKVFWVDEAFTALRISGYTEVEVVQNWTETPLTTVEALHQYQFPNAEKSVLGTIRGLATFEPQLPPLYFVLTRWWVQGWGDSVGVIRSFGAIASIATLPLLALLCQELFPARITAYVAVCLMAVSPFQVVYAQEARPYSLWTLLTVAASWALLRALRLRTPRSWVLYGGMLTLSLYTFVYTVWVLLAHGVYVLWQGGDRLRPFLLSAGVAILAFGPWIGAIVLNGHMGLQLASWQRQPLQQRFLVLPMAWVLHITRTFLDFDPTNGFDATHLLPYGFLVGGVVGLVGYAIHSLRKTAGPSTWQFVVLLLGIPALGVVGPDLLTGGQQSIVSRYFVPCWIAILLATAYALSRILDQRLGRLALAGLLTLQVLSCGTSSLALSWWNKQGAYIPYVAHFINQTERPLIISTSDWWIFSLAHALRPETRLEMVTRSDAFPKVPMGYSDYFLYSMPGSIQQTLTQQRNMQISAFEQLDQVPVGCLFPPDRLPGPCPATARALQIPQDNAAAP